MNDLEEIVMPTDEEREAWRKEFTDMMNWTKTLTQDQIDFLCDGGWYNNAIRGYLIASARNADFTDDQIRHLLNGLRWAFSEKNKRDAEKISDNF